MTKHQFGQFRGRFHLCCRKQWAGTPPSVGCPIEATPTASHNPPSHQTRPDAQVGHFTFTPYLHKFILFFSFFAHMEENQRRQPCELIRDKTIQMKLLFFL